MLNEVQQLSRSDMDKLKFGGYELLQPCSPILQYLIVVIMNINTCLASYRN